MKMLTGLLPATEGKAGCSTDRSMRRTFRYGCASATCRRAFRSTRSCPSSGNLTLHARLYRVPGAEIAARVAASLERFGLAGIADALPGNLPAGQRQRLSLAAACPSARSADSRRTHLGVDPEAQDDFWRLLIDLSRRENVTIFISTHFMNEAERCDRISLMHAGKTLAVGTPVELADRYGDRSLEEAFVRLIAAAQGIATAPGRCPAADVDQLPIETDLVTEEAFADAAPALISPARFSPLPDGDERAVARSCSPGLCPAGPVILTVTFGFGMSFDVENLTYAVLDRDQSLESRTMLESFSGSRYFTEKPPIANDAEVDRRLRSANFAWRSRCQPGSARGSAAGPPAGGGRLPRRQHAVPGGDRPRLYRRHRPCLCQDRLRRARGKTLPIRCRSRLNPFPSTARISAASSPSFRASSCCCW